MTIRFERNDEIMLRLRQLQNLKWSQTQSSWYVPYNGSLVSIIFKLLQEIAFIDYTESRPPILQNAVSIPGSEVKTAQVGPRAKTKDEQKKELNSMQLEKVSHFRNWLRSKRYSESTIQTYTEALRVFFRFFHNKRPEEIDNNDLIHFNNAYIIKNKCSSSYQNQVVNAVKLYYSTIEEKKLMPELIHRPKREKTLPNVLSKQEVKQLLTASGNMKHRTMLCLIYSCGLRSGELLRLKPKDIDSERGLIIVRQSKGRKDRVVPLSPKILELLREYYRTYKPQNYLFEGQNRGAMYDERSFQLVLKQNLAKTKINKPVTLHWLRHSYATHMLESGTDLRYIQELLGHSSSRTTEIYTHVSTKNLQNLASPFDTL
jgi:integrase/recombinase XerD